ncbi:uncharacterized protein DUF4012 [Isoptericola jiangsuensis]|uniref:Uncharacterized protein DUF4012 n=1 Tax=Isoptericola jiangsuensis TaxID=548579 RepID=A0A2A9EZY3_9MICO|nr:DUF4012 domain-containing protein [Isoptericola jiangsuensis]PFG44438.1 uncharacterized protein DUF4012 [Isoptericola jiangsuensis]
MPDATDRHGTPPVVRRAPHRRRRRALGWLLVAILVVAVGVAVCAVLIVRDAFTARDALDEAAAAVPAVEQAVRDGMTVRDPDAAPLTGTPALLDLQRSTQTAREATDGWLWAAAAHLPLVGESVGAATTVSAVIDDVADVALPALAETVDAATRTGRTEQGGLDLAPLSAVAGDVTAAREMIAASGADLAAIDTAHIQDRFAEPVQLLDAQLTELDVLLATAERATVLLPALLGADGPRRYVLLGLSNAELRAGGGIPGALTELRVDDGSLGVGAQASTGAFGPYAEPVLPLDPEDEAAYSARLGRFVQDVTLTPDFATTGPLVAEMWQRSRGEEVDGVLATDPVALSALLEVTGPVEIDLPPGLATALGTGTLVVESSTVVDLLLRRTYDVLDPGLADRFFAVVAAAVFDELTADDVSPAALLPALERVSHDHRLLVWSARPDEQALLAGTLVAGTFADDRARDAVGVFLDDLVVGKLSAYLDVQVGLGASACTDAVGREDTVEVTLTNRLDEGTAQDLPSYVAGPEGDPDRGRMLLTVSAYGPRDGGLPRLARDGGTVGGDTLEVHGRQRVAITVDLRPGESTVVAVTVPATAAGARGEGSAAPGTLEVWTTPTVSAPGLHVLDVPRCG